MAARMTLICFLEQLEYSRIAYDLLTELPFPSSGNIVIFAFVKLFESIRVTQSIEYMKVILSNPYFAFVTFKGKTMLTQSSQLFMIHQVSDNK